MLTQKEAREMWAARLEADPQRQGKGCLAPDEDHRCCLGELCDMAVELGVIDSYQPGDEVLTCYPEVMDLVGLTSTSGEYRRDGRCRTPGSLTEDNDDGLSWPEIAAVIRNEPEGLFK